MFERRQSYVIVANGEFLSASTLSMLVKDKILIAADGAFERLLNIGLVPKIVIGDFDSITNKKKWKIQPLTKGEMEYDIEVDGQLVKMAARPDQNQTDFFKSIEYVKTFEPLEIHLTCLFSEDRLDHALNNLRALRVFYSPNFAMYAYTDNQIMFYVKDSTVDLCGKTGDHCAVLGFPQAVFSSEGLRYNGNRYPLRFGFSESVSNELVDTTARVKIEGEALVIQEFVR
jgi:thiamine pyrophosphokinase